jgi:O-antigen/teichoic acid export membrane protein
MSTRGTVPTPDASPRGGAVRRLLTGSGQIAAAMMVMNIGTYAFSMTAARIIGPVAYGAFFALMNLMMIVSVVSLGLQATAARRISADPEHVGQIEREILRVSGRAALLLGAVLILGSPLINIALDLGSLPTAMLAGVAAIPLTMMGAQAGILQGERRWRELAFLYVLSGVPRFVVGVSFILIEPSEFMAFLGATVGFFAPYLYGARILRHRRGADATHQRHGFGAIIRESIVNSQALFAYFALTNTDMLVGRTILDSHDSGLYAAGLIVSRAVLFLPQFVVVVAFPSMSSAENRVRALTRSLALVAALGAACTAATAVLPDFALIFAGGGEYTEVRDQLWLFALLGTVMAMLQLLVYSVLARQGRLSVILVWVALAALIAGGLSVSSVTSLLTVVLVVDVTLLVVLLGVSVHGLRRSGPALEAPAAQ